MTEARQITLPLTEAALQSLRAGDMVELSGVLYTARDAAHARLCRATRLWLCQRSGPMCGATGGSSA